MEKTLNYELNLPGYDDKADIGLLNDNATILDQLLKTHADALAEKAAAAAGLPSAGVMGQVLVKSGDDDFATEWRDLVVDNGVITLGIPANFDPESPGWQGIPMPTAAELQTYLIHAQNNGLFALACQDDATGTSTVCMQGQATCDAAGLSILFNYSRQTGQVLNHRYHLWLEGDTMMRSITEVPAAAFGLQDILDTGNTAQNTGVYLSDGDNDTRLLPTGTESERALDTSRTVLSHVVTNCRRHTPAGAQRPHRLNHIENLFRHAERAFPALLPFCSMGNTPSISVTCRFVHIQQRNTLESRENKNIISLFPIPTDNSVTVGSG
ncbi:MAG: hypothetical protein AB7U63_17245 [Porticoccaceae bacterium]